MGAGGGGILAIQAGEADRLAKLAQNHLTTALGQDHASVIVTVVIDPTSTSDMTTTFSPDGKVAKSEKIESSATPGSGEGVKGGTEEKIETEYEVGKTTVKTEKFAGKITSLSASVLVDLSPPPTGEGQEASAKTKPLTVKDIEDMVRAAIVPGDLAESNAVVKVTETKFAGSLASQIEPIEEGGGFTDPVFLLEMGRRFSLGILVIGALLVLRMFRGPKKKATELAATGPQAQLAGQGVGTDHLLGAVEATPEVLRAQITDALQNNPEEVKKLFLHWIESKQEGA